MVECFRQWPSVRESCGPGCCRYCQLTALAVTVAGVTRGAGREPGDRPLCGSPDGVQRRGSAHPPHLPHPGHPSGWPGCRHPAANHHHRGHASPDGQRWGHDGSGPSCHGCVTGRGGHGHSGKLHLVNAFSLFTPPSFFLPTSLPLTCHFHQC